MVVVVVAAVGCVVFGWGLCLVAVVQVQGCGAVLERGVRARRVVLLVVLVVLCFGGAVFGGCCWFGCGFGLFLD